MSSRYEKHIALLRQAETPRLSFWDVFYLPLGYGSSPSRETLVDNPRRLSLSPFSARHHATNPPANTLLLNQSRRPLVFFFSNEQTRMHAHFVSSQPTCLHFLLNKLLFRNSSPQIMAPRVGGISDAVSRHFMSVLTHIEHAAGEAGVSVTIHDASKPPHTRLSLGTLVTQARRAQTGHSSTRGGLATPNTDGGPAAANMVRCATAVFS